jgi:hypothetical protein
MMIQCTHDRVSLSFKFLFAIFALAIDELQVDIAELEERLVVWGHDPKLSQAASVPVPLLTPF